LIDQNFVEAAVSRQVTAFNSGGSWATGVHNLWCQGNIEDERISDHGPWSERIGANNVWDKYGGSAYSESELVI
jgi:hypothetical protein